MSILRGRNRVKRHQQPFPQQGGVCLKEASLGQSAGPRASAVRHSEARHVHSPVRTAVSSGAKGAPTQEEEVCLFSSSQ